MMLKLNGWEQHMGFSACHIIPNHEKCGRLHGHSYAVHLELEGELDREGVVVDFSVVKDHLRDVIGALDHRVVIPLEDPNMTIEREEDRVNMKVGCGKEGCSEGSKRYVLPLEDVVFLEISSSSAEMLAQHISGIMANRLSNFHNLTSLSIGVDEGPGQGAWFRRRMG